MNPKRGVLERGTYSGFFAARQGQVTIFIIVGLLILVVFGVILFFTSSSKSSLTAQGEPILAAVPEEFAPLQVYTENCISQIGKQGLQLLGEQGGYISPETVGRYSTTDPTDADGINLEPLKVPYWHYNSESNSGNKIVFRSLQPKLYAKDDPEMSIESQLSRFVNERIESCLNNYAPFAGQGFEVDASAAADTEVHIAEETVNFWVKKEVASQRGGATHQFDQFYVKIPLRLKHYYEVANQITEAERNYSFLEKQGLELLSVYSGLNPQKFAPTSDVTYELFSVLSWNELSLKQKYVQLLSSYVPMLRFLGSENFYYSTFPEGNLLAQKVADNMVLPLTGAETLEINFDYFGWEPYFSTNSEEGTITPENTLVKFGVLHFGQQRYETHYDASYPVLVTLRDAGAFDGQGYTFMLALESNIRNNKIPEPETVRELYPRKITSLACNPEQRNSGPLKTIVVDSFTKEPLELVKVGFTIPNQGDCEVGTTDSRGVVESTYPPVYGGVINFVHPDYLTNFYPIDTYKYQNRPLALGYAAVVDAGNVIEMDRIKSMDVVVKKKELKKAVVPAQCEYTQGNLLLGSYAIPDFKDISCKSSGKETRFFNNGNTFFAAGDPLLEIDVNDSLTQKNRYYFMNQEKDLANDEQVFFTLERVEGFHQEVKSDAFTASVSINGTEHSTLLLVPGKYKVTGSLITKRNLHLPAEGRCFQYSILGYDKQECFTLEEQNMDSYISGAVQWDIPAAYLEITPEQLYTSNTITLYLLAQDIFSVPEQMSSIQKECVGNLCIPGVGCAFQGCVDKDIKIPARIMEDLQVTGRLVDLSKQPEMRRTLQPSFH